MKLQVEPPPWFRDVLSAAIKKAGSRRALARIMNVSNSTVTNWEAEGNPSLAHGAALLQYIGADLRSAIYGTDTDRPANIGLPVLGRVSAGAKKLPGEAISWVPGITEAAFRNRPYWSITTGPVVLLEVDGDSMWPDYQDGELIACRAPYSIRDLNDGIPCIFRELDGTAFKYLEWVPLDGEPDKKIPIGRPANHRYPAVRFRSLSDVRIEYVVLGRAGELGKVTR